MLTTLLLSLLSAPAQAAPTPIMMDTELDQGVSVHEIEERLLQALADRKVSSDDQVEIARAGFKALASLDTRDFLATQDAAQDFLDDVGAGVPLEDAVDGFLKRAGGLDQVLNEIFGDDFDEDGGWILVVVIIIILILLPLAAS